MNNLSNNNRVEFVSYTGKYPNLCSGVLTLRIDGVEYKFGHNFKLYDYKTNTFKDENPNKPNYPKFWSSGGSCGFHGYYTDAYIEHKEWDIDKNAIDIKFRDLADEIGDVFNDNVSYGCCGGCL